MTDARPRLRRFSRRAVLGGAVLGGTVLGTALGLPGLAAGARAQGGFPNRPIRIIVPWASGGGPDVIGRLIAEPMQKDLGQPILIDNRPGGGSMMGSEMVARAAPDGYTLLLTAGALAVAPSVRRDMSWDPARDLVGVALVAVVPLFVVVRPESPFNSMADLMAAARQPESARAMEISAKLAGALRAAAEELRRLRTVPFAGFVTDPCDGRTQGTTGMMDSLPYRNDAAMIFRRLIRSLPTRRGVVGVATCDKGLPAMMMTLAAVPSPMRLLLALHVMRPNELRRQRQSMQRIRRLAS